MIAHVFLSYSIIFCIQFTPFLGSLIIHFPHQSPHRTWGSIIDQSPKIASQCPRSYYGECGGVILGGTAAANVSRGEKEEIAAWINHGNLAAETWRNMEKPYMALLTMDNSYPNILSQYIVHILSIYEILTAFHGILGVSLQFLGLW